MSNLDALVNRLTADARNNLDYCYFSNSEFGPVLMSVANSCFNAGFTEDEFIAVVEAHDLGATYPKSDLVRSCGRAWTKAENSDYEGGALRPRLEKLYREIEASPKVPGGVRESALAMVSQAIEWNRYSFHLSARQIAEITGGSRAAAAKHMKRFPALGFVAEVSWSGVQGESRLWTLDTSWTGGVFGSRHIESLQGLICPSANTLWSRHGLGATARNVYFGMGLGPSSMAGVAKVSGCARSTVKRHMPRLVGAGLVVEAGDRFAVNLLGDADRASANVGVTESVESMRERHADERRASAETLAKREELRGTPWDPDRDNYRKHVAPFYYGQRSGEVVNFARAMFPGGEIFPEYVFIERLIELFGGNEFTWQDALRYEDSVLRAELVAAGFGLPPVRRRARGLRARTSG